MNEMRTSAFSVLVVDDDASIRATYRHILQPPPSELGGLEALISGAGDVVESENLFRVIEADQGETAVDLQRSALDQGVRYQLAFIDMRMPPGWDGMRTAIALRAQDPSIYIVIATAFSDYDVNALQHALEHDVVLLRKPFNQEEVYQLARTLCQSWETRQRLEAITAEMENRVLARTAELDRRNALQSVLVEITTRFVEASAESDIEDAVNWSLARLGRAIDVDGAVLYRFNNEQDCYTFSDEWHALGIKPLPAGMHHLPRAQVMPAHGRFLRGESFYMPHLRDLPVEMSSLRTLLEGYYEQLLVVPLEIGGRLVGCLGVGMVRSKADLDPGGMESLLRTVGHALARALDAHDTSQTLAQSQAMLARSESLTHIGSWELDVATDTVKWSDEIFRIFRLPVQSAVPRIAEHARFYHPEDWQRLLEAIDLAVKQGTPYALELRILRSDASTGFCLARGHAEMEAGFSPNQQVARLYGSFQDITQSKLAEINLRESESRFKTLVQNIPGSVYRCLNDQNWTIQYISSHIETLSGYPPTDFTRNGGLSYSSIVHPDDLVRVAEEVASANERHVPFVLEYRIIHADGKPRWVNERGQATYDANGQVVWLEGVITDITQRKQADMALTATAEFVSAPSGEDFFANLVRHAAETLDLDYVHIAYLQPDRHSVATQAAWLDGKWVPNWSYDLASTPCSEVLQNQRRCIESGVRMCYPDDHDLSNLGAEGYVGEPVISASQQVIGLIVGVTRQPLRNGDMIQANLRILATRAGAEWTWRESLRLLQSERDTTRKILQTAEVMIVALDLDGRITMINRKGGEILGYREDELVGQDWFTCCLPPNDQIEQIRAIFQKALANDLAGSEHYENPVRTRSGELRLIAWHNSSIRDVDGKVIGAMSAGMDVTEQRQAEALLHASEVRFQRLFEDADALAIQGFRPDGTVVFWNHASEKIYGYSAAEAIGRSLYDLIIPEAMRDDVRAGVRQLFESGTRIPASRLLLKHKDGSEVPVYSSHTVVESHEGEMVLFCMDINMTQLVQAEAALNVALTKYKTLFDSFPLGITVTDPNGKVLETNASAEQLLGIPTDLHARRGIAGPEWQVLHADGSPMPSEEFASVRALKEHRRIENVEMGVARPDGKITWLSVTADVLPIEGYGVVITYSDITARRAAEEQIRQLAYYDSLTNLPNRRLLMDRLDQALIASKRSHAFGALLMLDLDYFKGLNDSFGHDVGDQLLIEVARRLSTHVRQDDTVSRLGGDEYVVILQDIGTQAEAATRQALQVAEKIRSALSQPYQLGHDAIPYASSVSIGVRLFHGHQEPVETLLKQVDVALYQAKDAGRNQVVFFEI